MATVTTAPPIATAPPTPPPPSTATELYRFNVNEYERMVLDDNRVELINGYVVKKMPIKPKHSWTTKALFHALHGLIQPGWTWRMEQPVRIPDFDEPEPDFAIVRGTDDDYKDRHPGPSDVGLLVEVSETTLDRDRNVKLPVYARGHIPIYWIVNLVDLQVEVYTDPGPDGYGSSQVFTPGQVIPVVIDGRPIGQVAVDDILR